MLGALNSNEKSQSVSIDMRSDKKRFQKAMNLNMDNFEPEQIGKQPLA